MPTLAENVYFNAEPAAHVLAFLEACRLRRIRNLSIAMMDRRGARR